MKNLYHIAASMLLMFVLVAKGPAVSPVNFVIGVARPSDHHQQLGELFRD